MLCRLIGLSISTWTAYREELIARLKLARMAAWERVRAKEWEREQPQIPPREFKVDDKVRIVNHQRATTLGRVLKWRPKYLGPYVVVARNGPTEYTVVDPKNFSDTRKYNIDDLKPYVEFALRSNLFSGTCPKVVPENLPPPETHTVEEEVVKIHDDIMRGNQKMYLVQYAHLDEGYKQWLPESLLFCPKLIQEYEHRKKHPIFRPPVILGLPRPRPRSLAPKTKEGSIQEVSASRVDRLMVRYADRYLIRLAS